MPDALPRKAGPAGKPPASVSGAPKKAGLPGQPGMQPGDEWGEDNPGNQHGVGVDDHVFFHRDGAGPHAGKVVAHGVHGCQVEDDGGTRHKVRWSRVLGVKQKAILPSKVVDRGQDGAIVEHPGGRRVYVAGDLGLPDEGRPVTDLVALEDGSRAPRPRKLSELEEFARAAGDRTMAKSFSDDHECEGPALCRVCAARRERAGYAPDLAKSFSAGLDRLEAAVSRLHSVGAGSRPLPRR